MGEPASNFKLINDVQAEKSIRVRRYRSSKTGLTVILCDVNGPIVHGYFTLATETFDDDGLPHTLEHLIFLGSEDYPYKGILDLLANTCLGNGTNAWTDTDHTSYTITNIGQEAFLITLPIFLNHILFPTLTESGFITEVHHVDGEGCDGGVVYCEMQTHENTGENLVLRALINEMYPGKCGYKSETGGRLENLRTSTNNEKVKNYHKQYYRPDNLHLIIAGIVDPAAVFAALEGVENKLLSHNYSDDFVRPWQSAIEPLDKSITKTVMYPNDEDNANGIMYIGWRGPSAIREVYRMLAVIGFLDYLTETSVSPLQQAFLETTSPLASSVTYEYVENSECVLYLEFHNVPKDKLSDIKPLLFEVLKGIKDKESVYSFDMKQMVAALHRKALDQLSMLENSPHEMLVESLVGDILYGQTSEDFEGRLNEIENWHKLKQETSEFWMQLLDDIFFNSHYVCIIGTPSIEEMKRLSEENENRVKERCETLGEAGLAKLKENLAKAYEENEKEIPDEMLDDIDLPHLGNITYHSLVPYSNCLFDSPEITSVCRIGRHPANLNMDKLHFRLNADDTKTNFVHLYVQMDTNAVPNNLKPYISLYLELLLVSPLIKDGKVIPYEEVVGQLNNDTQSSSAGLGITMGRYFHCGPYSQTAMLFLRVEREKYEVGVDWIYHLLYSTHFTVERLIVVIHKILKFVDEVKRNGESMLEVVIKDCYYTKESNTYHTNLFRKTTFLKELLDAIQTEAGQISAVENLNTVRSILTDYSNITVHMAADFKYLMDSEADPFGPWRSRFTARSNASDPVPVREMNVTPDYHLINLPMECKGFITGIGSVETSHFVQVLPCITEYTHQDVAKIMFCIQYLTQSEGPMWQEIRDTGLAYDFSIVLSLSEGLLYFYIKMATNIPEAYRRAKLAVEDLMREDAWDHNLFEAARSSLIFEIIDDRKTVGDMINSSLMSYLRKVDHNHFKTIIYQIEETTLSELRFILVTYIYPLFDVSGTNCFAVCHPSKIQSITESFSKMGRALHEIQDTEAYCLAK